MVVKSLYLKNFRNYTQELINFKKNVKTYLALKQDKNRYSNRQSIIQLSLKKEKMSQITR